MAKSLVFGLVFTAAAAVGASNVCSQSPYSVFLPLSSYEAAKSYCSARYPLSPCTSTITSTATVAATVTVATVTTTISRFPRSIKRAALTRPTGTATSTVTAEIDSATVFSLTVTSGYNCVSHYSLSNFYRHRHHRNHDNHQYCKHGNRHRDRDCSNLIPVHRFKRGETRNFRRSEVKAVDRLSGREGWSNIEDVYDIQNLDDPKAHNDCSCLGFRSPVL